MSAAIPAVMLENMGELSRSVVQAALYSKSLHDFVRNAWTIHEPGTPFKDNWHIGAICDHLEAVTRGQIRNLLINQPPRTTKSVTISVLWPAWVWTHSPHIQWLFSSYAQDLSTRDAVSCRRVIESPWYRERWGDVFALTTDQNVKKRYDNDQGGRRISTSVDAMTTGEGGDIIVVDDPHNVKQALSETKRKAVLSWWRQSMSTRLNDPMAGRRVVVMQRIHEEDLSGHILERGGWEHLCLPEEYEPKRRQVTVLGPYDKRKKAGELLHPKRRDEAALAELKKELGEYGTAGQLQQRPAPAEGGVFKEKTLRFYDEPPPSFDEILQSWDMKLKKEGKSFVVGEVWGRVGGLYYLLDLARKRASMPEALDMVRRMSVRWPMALAKLVENKATGPAIAEMLRDEIPGIVLVEPMGDKLLRAHAITPAFNSGNVLLPQHAAWLDDFLAELLAFPNAATDDQVDAMTQALSRMLHAAAVPTDALPEGVGRSREHVRYETPAADFDEDDTESARAQGRPGW